MVQWLCKVQKFIHCAQSISHLFVYHAVLRIMGYAEEVDFLLCLRKLELLTQIVPAVYLKNVTLGNMYSYPHQLRSLKRERYKCQLPSHSAMTSKSETLVVF